MQRRPLLVFGLGFGVNHLLRGMPRSSGSHVVSALVQGVNYQCQCILHDHYLKCNGAHIPDQTLKPGEQQLTTACYADPIARPLDPQPPPAGHLGGTHGRKCFWRRKFHRRSRGGSTPAACGLQSAYEFMACLGFRAFQRYHALPMHHLMCMIPCHSPEFAAPPPLHVLQTPSKSVRLHAHGVANITHMAMSRHHSPKRSAIEGALSIASFGSTGAQGLRVSCYQAA